MPWIDLEKPDAGETTDKSWADAVVDNLGFLKSATDSSPDTSVPNPSFEIDTDNDGKPNEWTFTPLPNGNGTLVTSAQIHGQRAFKFTRALGNGNGGGELITTDFFEVSEKRPLELQWSHYCTAAGMHDKVEVLFYDVLQTTLISTVAAYDSTSNPTAWRIQSATVTPPTNARYAKLKITGGATDANFAGDSFWDDFKFQESGSRAHRTMTIITASGTWTCPNHITRVKIRLWGGGGAGDNAANSGGGGSGEYVEAVLDVNPGQGYTVNIGAGGTSAGAAGGNTNIGTLLTAAGGTGGSGAGGGAGGTGGGGSATAFRIAGQRGRNGLGGIGIGGAGGDAPCGGGGGSGTASSGTNGVVPGGGGGGGNSAAAGDGANGRIIIEY